MGVLCTILILILRSADSNWTEICNIWTFFQTFLRDSLCLEICILADMTNTLIISSNKAITEYNHFKMQATTTTYCDICDQYLKDFTKKQIFHHTQYHVHNHMKCQDCKQMFEAAELLDFHKKKMHGS